jgi:pimeloyl-ACP methyl ester carboxylesterase
VALDRFVDGLHATHRDGSTHVTAVGHSYGSVVVGHAAQQGDGLAVGDIATAGSPGMGTSRGQSFPLVPRDLDPFDRPPRWPI